MSIGRTKPLSIGTVPAVAVLQGWVGGLQDRWVSASPALRVRVQISVLVVVTFAAYHYSLESLSQTLGFDTPLAYLALVPIIAAILAFIMAKPSRPEPQIRDRQLDYIIGVPLILLALIMTEYLPHQQSVLYWLRREDLLSLPIFVAGAVAILFGTRVMWRQKVAILYLFLAWPWPYTTILLGTLNSFTNVTVWGLTKAVGVVHLATPVTNSGQSGLFSITHAGRAFPVSVVSACSGVDGMVGFFLVGTAFAAIVRGPRLRKALWLAAGLVLLWTTNLFRLLLIFWAGKEWGEHVAISVLHPLVGLLIFNIGVIFMVLLLRPFGLRLRSPSSTPAAPSPAPRPAQPIFLSALAVVVVGMLLAANNSSLRTFDVVASAAGDPRLSSYLADPGTPPGWAAQYTTEYFQNKTLFGESSRWFRYTYFDRGGGDLFGTLPVTADVINAKSLSGFNAYGVTACYDFHGYTMRDVSQVDLGSGIRGQALSFTSTDASDWSVVYWLWPVRTGTQNRYERIILYLANTKLGQVSVAENVPGISGIKNALSPNNATDKRLIINRAFLVRFAREIVQQQTHIHTATVQIADITPPAPSLGGAVPTANLEQQRANAWAKKRAEILRLSYQNWLRARALAGTAKRGKG
jgi:exosortase/archaeosortase family protein